MKRIYSVNDSKVVLGLLSGLKSRITSINSRIWTIITPMLFVAFGLFGVNESVWGVSKTKLTVKISGSGQIKLNNSSSQPDSWSSKELSKSTSHGGFAVRETDYYYIWVKASDGYYCSGVSGATWNNGGYYTRSIEGRTWEVSETSTATFVGNSYTLTFDGNGKTSGSMTNQSFVYGTAQNIKANGFTRAYTVTYQANGGTCSTASATATYTLAGWAKSANGDVEFDPGQQLKTPTPIPEHGDVIDLFAVWNAVSVTLPTPTKDGFLFDGWYNGDTYVGKGGESYTPTAGVTLTAHWAEKLTPQFVLDKSQVELDQKAVLTLTNVNNPSINISPAGLVAYNAQTGELTAQGLGTVYITITQQAVGDIKYKQEQLTLEVIRKTPSLTLYIDGEERTSKSIVQGRKAEITYDKVSDANVVVTNVSGGSYAAYANGEITASEIGTAVFRATLPQTNTYQSTYVEFSIKVTEDLSHLPITINSSDVYDAVNEQTKGSGDRGWDDSNGIYLGKTDSWSTGNWDDKYVTIHFVGVPDKLSFKYKYVYRSENFKTTAVPPLSSTDPNQRYYLYIEESANGSDWTPLAWQNTAPTTTEQSSGDQQLKKTTRYLRFHLHANYGAYYREIKVTELKYVQDPDPANIDLGTAVINSGEVSKTTLVNWCNVAPLAVTSSNPRFTVSPTSFGGYENYGSQTLTISYTHGSAVGPQEADITLSNGNANYNKTIHVTAETTKRPQTITWNNTLVSTGYAMNVGEQYPDASIAAVATVARGARVTYTSANSNFIEVVADTALLAKGVGKVKIAAHQAGDDEYAAVSDTVEFQVTNLLKQSITWDQDLMSLLTTSGTVELNATASSNGQITYTSGNSDVVSVSGNTLTVVGEGETTITATQAGGEIGGQTYLPISLTASVYVRNPASQCNGKALNVNSLTLSSSHLTQEYTLSGIPETLTFSAYHGTKSGQWGTAPSYASLIVEQYACINDLWDWYEVYNHVVGTSATASGNVSIDASATKIRFRTGETAVDHTISSILVSRKKFMSADVESVDLNVEANSIWQQTITVSHSNIDKMSVTTKQGLLTLSSSTLGGGCGDFGDDAFEVSYTPTNKNTEYKDTIVITDGKTVPSTIEIPVRLYAQALNQMIEGFDLPTSAKTTDLINLTATATSGLAVTYYTSNDQIAQIINNNQLIFVAAGEVTVTASQIGGGAYNAAPNVEQTIVAAAVSPALTTYPTAKAITYRSTLENSTWTEAGVATVTLRGVPNTVVAGSFSWNDPKHVVMDAAGEHSYKVTFTPSDGGMYTTNTCNVEITVNKADQTLTMNNGTVKVAVGGIDEGADDSKLDLDGLINTQTADVVNAVKRDGVVTYEVISENKANASIGEGNIFSATVIGDYTIRAAKAETGFYNEATADFTVSVTKRANTMVTAGPYEKYVDEEVLNVATVVNSDGEIHTSSTDATVAYYDVANNKIVIPNSEAKSFDQTEVTIKIWQDGTTRFEGIAEADAKTITLTVKKYDNPFACSWGSWSYTANFEDVVPVEFTTANTDYANFPIVITQTSGKNVATLVNNDATHNTITASYVRDNATWHLSQAESYKYKAGAHDVSMLVRTLPATCYIFEDNTEHSFETGIGDFTGHYDDPIAISGPAKAISFEAKMSGGLAVNKFIAEYSVDNCSSWRTIMEPDLDSEWGQTYTKNFSEIGLGENERVTHIRFGAKTGATYSKWYRNIKVTRATNIKPLDKENNLITAMTMPQNTVGGSTTEKFYMKFSSCDDVVKLASNNSHFTLDKVEIANDLSKDEVNAEVTVTYSSNEVGTHNGVITLYTKYQNRTFIVSGTTEKKVQTIEWKEGFTGDPLTLQKGLVVDNTNIAATASSERPVMYSTDNVDVIEIILNGLGFRIKGEGSANLTASEAGDDYVWAPVSETKTIHATGKPVQTILWDQNLVNDLELGQVIELDAKVYIRDAETGDLTYNAERTALINYSCSANSVISLDGKTITVTGYGQTTITATVAGDATYVEAQPVVVSVRVREPSAGCETPLVLNHPENVRLYSTNFIAAGLNYTTPQVVSQIDLDRTKGKPDKLSYKHNGELASIPVFGAIKLCGGAVKVQERVNGSWNDVEGSYFDNDGKTGNKADYNWRDVMDLQLNENADAIRFVRLEHGSGAHNFKDIQITLLQYIRPVQAVIEAENVLDLGDIEVGEAHAAVVSFDYSDVKGEILAAKGNTEDAVLELNQKTVYLDCGSYGQYDLPITLRPTVEGEWSNTVTLTDRLTNVATTITVRANVVPAVRYIFTGNEGDKQWGTNNNWDENSTPGADDNVIIRSDVEITGDVTVGSLTIDEGATVTVTVTGRLRIKDGSSYLQAGYGDLHVADGGSVTVGNGVVMVRDFILDAKLGDADNAAASGQLSDEKQKLVVMNDAYFQMSFDVSGQITYGWYDFVVPFEVDAKNGVFDENGVQIVYGTDYIIMSHSEEKRARNQKAWSTFTGILEPGRIYTITFEDTKTWNTFLFKKMAGSDLANNGSYTSAYSSTIGESQDRGWNGFGNGTLQHRELTDLTGISKVQMYNHTYNRYDVVDDVDWSTKALAVGTAFSIQVLGEQSIVLTEADAEKPLRAPKMDNSRTIEEFYLTLTDSETAKTIDRLWVSASEDATGEYVIGRDLLKMGTPTQAKVAQMWAINNNLTLCDIEMPFVSEQASCALGLFAPKAGSYELMIERAPEDADLYLTYNDQVIWDLTASPYVFDLEKGTTEGYGLRIMARAPQITTGVDETNADSKSVRKVVINDKIYIITPEGEMYDIVGKSVKF